jgi:hypothetical protein
MKYTTFNAALGSSLRELFMPVGFDYRRWFAAKMY